jgi:hypothetical protein
MLATDITNGPGQTYYVAKTGSDSTTLASGGVNGKHQDTPFLTVAKALSTATSGDIIYISPGTYTETFPLTIPDGVTVRGAGIRSVLIQPSPATNTQNGFVLNGDTHVSDLTIGGILYNAGLDRGYAIVCASNWNATRSSYVERVTVLNRGSVTSLSDPYGFAQGDAGRGAKLDGSISSASSYEAAVLFNECTFFTPNQIGLYMTNGIRVELLNSFFYFASEAIKGAAGATGVAGNGRTRLKIGGVSGTFSAGETIYELSNNFVTGSYTQSGTTITVTSNAHGLSNGDHVYADFTSGTAVDGFLTVSSAATNTFVLTAAASATTSGNVQYKEVLAYGLIDENDGTYLYLDGKGNGEFSSTASTAKTAVTTGDAKLSTAQFKFGTASLLLDGTGDYISYPTNVNFGFGLGDFTIECFARFDVVNDNLGIFDFRAAAGSEVAPLLYLNASGRLVYQVGATARITGGNTLSVDTWYHIAVSRIGDQTKLFVNGVQEGSTYTDTNDYGSTKQLQIGSIRNANYEFDGYIDEVRISKGIARYTSNFTAPAAAFAEDIYTVLLLHLDGANASTTILDSSGSTKDIRSSGGDSATTINLVDYTDFGAELRSIGCAAVYGTKAVVADGLGVVLRLTAANFEYIGTGADITNNAANTIQANEITELNGGRVYYTSQDQSGNFRVGDLFVVDQELGNVTFSATTQNAQSAASITLSDGTGTTNLYPAYIETGNLRLSGNTLSSTSGNIILDPSSDEDIILNAEIIAPEEIYLRNDKKVGIDSNNSGSGSFNISTKEQAGWSSYGLYTNKNISVFAVGVDSVNIDQEGSSYVANTYALSAVSDPTVVCTLTANLESTGGVKTVTLTNPGSGYTTIPVVSTTSGSPTAPAAFTASLKGYGSVKSVSISVGGSNYVSPTIVFDNPPLQSFNAASNVSTANDTISYQNGVVFENDDTVVYSNGGGTQNIGLTDGATYYVINATSTTLQLAASQGGTAIPLTTASQSESHSLRGTAATGTVQQSGGTITGVTITNPGVKYSVTAGATINDPSGNGVSLTVLIGRKIDSILISDPGSGYTSAPSISITGDGVGGSASSTIGYEVGSVTINNPGEGYSFTPSILVSGGNPNSPAQFSCSFDKKSGEIDNVTIIDPGVLYTSAPTLTVVGGSGSGAQLSVTILPFEGTISNSGSGYKPGIYNNVPLLGGSPTSNATATITVPGIGGIISNSGSGYTPGSHPNVTIRNTPTTIYTVTTVNRKQIVYTNLSGGSFSAGNTITGQTSGASGVATYVGTNASGDTVIRFSSITNGPFTSGETITSGSVTATIFTYSDSVNVYSINGQETPNITLSSYNTYVFNMSDPSNVGHPLEISGYGSGQVVWSENGAPGTTNAEVVAVFTNTAVPSSATVKYQCITHGGTMGNYINVTDGSGSPGVYGSGASLSLIVAQNGTISSVSFANQGTGYKVSDTFGIPSNTSAGSGSSFQYTINSYSTSISSVTNISPTGGPYLISDILSVDPNFDGEGVGGGFSYTLSKVGFVDSVSITSPGYGFTSGETLKFTNAPQTSGTPFSLSVDTTIDDTPIEINYDGSIVSNNWYLNEDGSGEIGTTGTSLTLHSVSSDDINVLGGILTSTLQVGSSASILNLTANGTTTLKSADIELQNGSAAAPSLQFTNSTSTGLYRDAADVLGITAGGTARVKISTSDIQTTNNIKVDSAFGATTPFFFVNSIGESVDIGAPETGLRINNDASIEAIGSDLDVDITFIPKGEGNLVLTGGTNKDFSITDGSTETFRVDTESGNTTIKGRLDINSNLRIDDNIISNNGLIATTSFGQIITVSATGTGTGFTDGTYVAVTSTTSGSGSGATFNVIVTGGNITAVAVNAGGAGYAEGDTITLNPATIGAGTGKTITVTDIEGAGIVIKPQNGKNVKVESTAMFVVPTGTTNQRPPSGDRQVGGIRFNSEQQQFEGYNGSDFVSLGGVRDVNQDTYILTELSPGSNEDTFFFYNQGINSLDIVQNKFKLYTAKTFDTYGTLTLNGVTFGSNPLDVQTLGSSVLRVRSQKDVEVTGGLRFKSVPVLGEIATIGTVTSGVGVYTASQTFTAVASTSQFEGSGATFTVVIDGAGSVQSVTLVASGSDYEVGEIVTIAGNLLGGTTPANNVTFPVSTIANTSAAFARLDILQQDYVTQLDNKPFLTLDANGAEAAWKINRGWNSGTESYLTVFNSTATFMELNDCRVEGGQLSSFASNSTIVQFNKTTFKGAKTLVTIESNDGKVHMLEVTTVCATAGTTAYATVTNSVTSNNDLVDATVTVVGNNVNISLNKSSAATSSSSFTGRYTTTKVKV